IPLVATEFGLDDLGAGLLSTAVFLSYLVVTLATAGWIVRVRPKLVVAIGLVCAATGAALFASAPAYSVAIAAKALQGLGSAVAFVSAQRYIAGLYGERRSHFGLGLYGAGFPLGSGLALIAMPALAQRSRTPRKPRDDAHRRDGHPRRRRAPRAARSSAHGRAAGRAARRHRGRHPLRRRVQHRRGVAPVGARRGAGPRRDRRHRRRDGRGAGDGIRGADVRVRGRVGVPRRRRRDGLRGDVRDAWRRGAGVRRAVAIVALALVLIGAVEALERARPIADDV